MLSKHLRPVLLALAIAAAVAGAALLYAGWGDWSSTSVPPIRLLFIESALQVLIVTVIGTLSTYLADVLQKHREKENGERELRMLSLRRASEAYAAAKKVRRQLRTGVDAKNLFDPLNDAQLEFESLKREVKTAPIFADTVGIAAAFKSMEEYLHGIIKSCETAPRNMAWCYPFTIPELADLADFSGKYEGSGFEARFAYAFDVVLALMQSEILSRPAVIPAHRTQKPGERVCEEGWFNPFVRS